MVGPGGDFMTVFGKICIVYTTVWKHNAYMHNAVWLAVVTSQATLVRSRDPSLASIWRPIWRRWYAAAPILAGRFQGHVTHAGRDVVIGVIPWCLHALEDRIIVLRLESQVLCLNRGLEFLSLKMAFNGWVLVGFCTWSSVCVKCVSADMRVRWSTAPSPPATNLNPNPNPRLNSSRTHELWRRCG